MNHCLRAATACAMAVAGISVALAQSPYPSQPIRFVVTTAPGGGLDSFSQIGRAHV